MNPADDNVLNAIRAVISMYHTTRLTDADVAAHIWSKPVVQKAFAALRTQAPMPAASAEPVAYQRRRMYPDAHDAPGVKFQWEQCGWEEATGRHLGSRQPGYEYRSLYAAQAPMPGEVGELVEALIEAGKHPCRVDSDFGRMHRDAATLIQSLQQEVDALKVKSLDLRASANAQLTEAQRVKDEAVGLLGDLVEAYSNPENGEADRRLSMHGAKVFLAQHGDSA